MWRDNFSTFSYNTIDLQNIYILKNLSIIHSTDILILFIQNKPKPFNLKRTLNRPVSKQKDKKKKTKYHTTLSRLHTNFRATLKKNTILM